MATRTSSGPLRVVLWVLGAIAALVLIAWIALAILLPPAKVKALVEQQLAQTLARPVRFESASVSLFPPVRLAVSDLALAEPGGFEQGNAVALARLDLDVDVFALLARRLVVRRLVLEHPQLHLVLRADGTTNFDGLMKPPAAGAAAPGAPAPAFDLAVQSLVIRDGEVLVDDLKSARRTAFEIGSGLAFGAEQGGARISTSGRTTIRGLSFGPLAAARRSDLNTALAKITWVIEHRGKFDAGSKRLALERLGLAFGRTSLDVSGVIDDPGPQAAVDLRARGHDIDLGDVLRALAVADAAALHGIAGGGQLEFDLATRGRLGGARLPDVTGMLRVKNGAFRYPGAPAGVEALALTANFAPDSLGIPDLACRVSGQPVHAQLAVTRFADPIVRFAVQGDLDLAVVGPLAAPKDVKLGGRAAVNVSGRGRAKDPGSIALEGTAKLSEVSVTAPQLPNPIQHVNGALAFSNARATVKALTLAAGKSSLTLDADVTRPLALMAKPDSVPPAGVNFTLRSPYLDLAEVMPGGGGAPILPNATGGGTVAIARLKQQKLDVSNVNAKVAFEPGVLSVPSYALDGYGGALAGSARLDFHDPAKPAYALKAKIDSVRAEQILGAWTPLQGLIKASLNTSLDLSGAGTQPAQIAQSLTAIGAAALANGTIGPGPSLDAIAQFVKVPQFKEVSFRDLKVPFHVEKGRVITDGAKLTGSFGDWTFVGGAGFDGALDYAVSVTLPPDVVAKLDAKSALAAGALADDQGRVLLDLKLTGNAKSPKVAWDTNAMRDRLAGRASAALAEQRSKLAQELSRSLTPQNLSSPDSLKKLEQQLKAANVDTLKKVATGLFNSIFKPVKKDTTKAKPPAPAASPTPAPAAPDTAAH